MLLSLKHLSYHMKSNTTIIFIPWNKKGNADPVRHFIDLLSLKLKLRNTIIVLESYLYNSFSNMVEKIEKLSSLNKIVIFAHPFEQYTGFAINNDINTNVNCLSNTWWNNSQKHEIFFAHVCFGSKILSKDDWKPIINNWISYNDKIYCFISTDKGKKRWKLIISEVLKVISKYKSVYETKMELIKSYETIMETIDKTQDWKGGDILNIMFIENCIQTLTTSEEL